MTRYARYGGAWVDLCPATGGGRLPPDDPVLHPINATYGDEFDAATLDAAWTKRNIAQAEVPVAATSSLSAGLTLVFDAQGDAIFRPAPSGDFEIVAGFRGTDGYGGMTGLAVVDSAGTGVACSPYDGGAVYTWAITTYNHVATGPNTGGSPPLGSVYWLAFKKVGSSYTARYSTDGMFWLGPTSTIVGPVTPDRIGILRAFTTGGALGFTIYRFNVYPSPGFYS